MEASRTETTAKLVRMFMLYPVSCAFRGYRP
jgi:hypothetical protein